jgi:hypothetical protein
MAEEGQFESGMRDLARAVRGEMAKERVLSDAERAKLREKMEAEVRPYFRREWPTFSAFKEQLGALVQDHLSRFGFKEPGERDLLCSNLLLAYVASCTKEPSLIAFIERLVQGEVLNTQEIHDTEEKLEGPISVFTRCGNGQFENVRSVLRAFSAGKRDTHDFGGKLTEFISSEVEKQKSS